MKRIIGLTVAFAAIIALAFAVVSVFMLAWMLAIGTGYLFVVLIVAFPILAFIFRNQIPQAE